MLRRYFENLGCKKRIESGETLVETLVAVLISSLAMLMLAMSISVAYHLISDSQQIANTYYGAETRLAAVEPASGTQISANVAIDDPFDESSSDITKQVGADKEVNMPGGVTVISYEAK